MCVCLMKFPQLHTLLVVETKASQISPLTRKSRAFLFFFFYLVHELIFSGAGSSLLCVGLL